METWKNKIAVVTGASSGIGVALVKDLLKENLIVIGLARRVEKVEEIRRTLSSDIQKKFHAMKCDVSNEDNVKKCFETICENFGGIDVLINNAGILHTGNLTTMSTDLIKQVLDVNVMGVVYCTREAFKSMQKRNVNGHVVLINSIAGHRFTTPVADSPSLNIYPASKFGITAMTEVYRQEFSKLGNKVKITSVSPGLTNTEIVPDEWKTNPEIGILQPADISSAVIYALSTPPHVQMYEMTVLPTGFNI